MRQKSRYRRRRINGRQRGAVEPLKRIRANWASVLEAVRAHHGCGFSDVRAPLVPKQVSNIYEAKLWSQLLYDSVVPFDTRSRALIKRRGYSDPSKDFLGMNRELFDDAKIFATNHRLSVGGLRALDAPVLGFPEWKLPVGGQPLSRVIDKIFYIPQSSSLIPR